jgi:hypothetical protein
MSSKEVPSPARMLPDKNILLPHSQLAGAVQSIDSLILFSSMPSYYCAKLSLHFFQEEDGLQKQFRISLVVSRLQCLQVNGR